MTTTIAIVGNPVDGMSFYGPFTTAEEANDWCSDEVTLDWWTATLHEPEDK